MCVRVKYFTFVIAALSLLTAGQSEAQNGPGRGGPDGDAGAVQLRPTGVVAGEYIVVFRDGIGDPRTQAEALARAHGLGLGHVYTAALKGFSARVPASALNALGRDPRVDYIEPDQWVQAFGHTGPPTPTGIHRVFAIDNPNITVDGIDDLRIDVDVAVIDTGIDHDHPELIVVAGTDCVQGSCSGTTGEDGNGHGSHVAGTIAAIDNGSGVVGVAPGARLWAVRVLDNRGSGKISWVTAGIDWVTARADTIEVANMSLGCECSSDAMDTAIANSVTAGIIYAVAAGNNAADTATHSPANNPYVITVSALADFDGVAGGNGSPTCRNDLDDTLASFSNYGGDVEITAPGACILSAWKNGGYATASGTSMAAPHVAGAAALLAASGMSSPNQIRNKLIAEGNANWTDDSGDGIKEPLLDVGNSNVFAPATVPGPDSVGEPAPDQPPSVSWVSPTGTVGGASVVVLINATDDEDADDSLAVQWRVDGGPWQDTVYSGSSADYEASWDSTTVADGGHTLGAIATDSATNVSSEAEVTITVDNAGSGPAMVNAADVSYATDGGRNKNRHLLIAVIAKDDGGAPVSGAEISVTVDFDRKNDGSVDKSRVGSSTTGGDGTATFVWNNAPAGGCYATAVTSDGLTPLTNDPGYCR